MATTKRAMALTKKRASKRIGNRPGRLNTEVPTVRAKGNGQAAKNAPTEIKKIEIPALEQTEMLLTMVGDRPLVVNNKLSVAARVAKEYSGPPGGRVKKTPPTDDEAYAGAFYVMPDSKYPPPSPKGSYGIPVSGIKKCVCSAIRTTGITDNTTIGLIAKSFDILGDGRGLCRLKFKKLERDIRPVNIGSGQKTVPQMRHRPMFHDWSVTLRIRFNSKILSEEQIVNLFMHAGAYIGWGELRSDKKQGECGGFVVEAG